MASGSKRILFGYGICGASAVAAQFSLIRTVLVTQGGSELAVCIVITLWLLFAGIGSFTASWATERARKVGGFTRLYFLFGFLIPAGIFWAGSVRTFIFGYEFTLDFGRSTLLALLSCFPISFTSGFLFVWAVKSVGSSLTNAPIRLYLAEALGSLLGGIVLSFVFAELFTTIQIALITGAILFLSGFLFLSSFKEIPVLKWFFIVFFTGSVLFAFVPGLSRRLDVSLLKLRFQNEKILFFADSRYQNFAVTQMENNTYFYQNGVLSYFSQGGQREEEIVHIPLLQVDSPQHILMIGGWAFIAKEILKHPVESLDIAVEDEKIHRHGFEFIPHDQRTFLADERVTILYGDPFRIVQSLNKRYSAVFIEVGSPETLLTSRYYTEGFFNILKRILVKKGIVVFTAPTSPNYLTDALLYLNSSIYRTVKKVFGEVTVIPGEYAENIFITGVSEHGEDLEPAALSTVLKNRGLHTKWVTAQSLVTILDRWRIKQLNQQLREFQESEVNTRENPIVLFYALENRQMRAAGGVSFRFLTGFTLLHFLIILCIVWVVIVLMEIKLKRQLPIITFVFSAGFSGMVIELSILFSFQVLYGYIYEFVGLFIGIFMGGLSIGALVSMSIRNKERVLTIVYIVFIGIIFAYHYIMNVHAEAMKGMLAGFLPTVMLYTGFSTALAFGTVLSLYTAKSSGTGKPGVIYGADLVGGSVGGIFASILFLPIVGITGSIFYVIVLLAFSLLLFLSRSLIEKLSK